MTSHPLDNPIWNGLNGPHRQFARRSGNVLAYRPEIALFVAVEDPTAPGMSGLAELIAPDGTVGFATVGAVTLPDDVEATHVADVGQMVLETLRPAEVTAPIVTLDASHAAAMIELVALTRPGPFQSETWRLGEFRGIFDGERLAAMAGERMKLDGMTEISAVCVHPDYRGRGYAKQLVTVGAAVILARGDVVFLHAAASNAPAIRLYEELGFKTRQMMTYTIVNRR